jgi:hypothetical protein
MYSNIYNSAVLIFKSIKAIGSIRNSTNPVLGLIDAITNASDFEVLKLKPLEQGMKDNVVYFFGIEGNIYYISKDMPYDNPVRVFEKDFIGFKDFKGNLVFQKIKDKIEGRTTDLDLFSKGAMYRFLLGKGKFIAGIKYAFHRHIAVPYRKFERNFDAKYPLIHKVYLASKKIFLNLCTIAVSETGARALGLTVAIGLAVGTGGVFFAVAAGVYAAGICISIIRQTASKVRLNRMKEEANLLEKYAATYKKKLLLSMSKNIKFKDSFFKEEVIVKRHHTAIEKWGISSFKYLSTFGIEVGAPIVAAVLAPIPALVQFSVMVGSAALSVGVGVFLRKVEEDKKIMLKNVIKDAQQYSFIPEYKNIQELREYAKLQENHVKALERIEITSSEINSTKEFNRILNTLDVDIPKTSRLKEYSNALFEVINPFDRTKEVKDSREVLNPINKLSDAIKMYDLFNQEELYKLVKKSDIAPLSCVKEGGRIVGYRSYKQPKLRSEVIRH